MQPTGRKHYKKILPWVSVAAVFFICLSNSGFTMSRRYAMTTGVRLLVPTNSISSIRFWSVMLFLRSAVFMRSVSQKPSCGPRTTFSESGWDTVRCSHVFVSHMKQMSHPSANTAQHPKFMPRVISEKSPDVLT